MNTSELVTVDGIQITTTVNEAFRKLADRISQVEFGTQITIKQGGSYMSEYDVVEELVGYVDANLIEDRSVKGLIEKAKQSKEEFMIIASDVSSYEKLKNALNELDKNYYTQSGEPDIFTEVVAESNNPHIVSGTTLYGIPNTTQKDPRRTGKIIVLNDISYSVYNKMLAEAPAYGFVWYGPKKYNIWLYVGDQAKNVK